ncbi:SRSO17 transposase [Azospirillum canadense]|nr:SRSO17 transposase [Azospirillum canadense]
MAQTSLDRQDAAERRFEEYLEAIGSVLGHADRRAPMHDYCTGLLLPGPRKSVEPMAARVAPQRVQAAHQSLHHFVAKAEWNDEAILDAVRERVLPPIERHGPIRHWIIDDTGVPKKGKLSVGVARQYCGQLGKQDNCQVAVTLSVANEQASLPIAYRLYLPQSWADDLERRRTAGVPEAIGFETKPQIALGQVRAALAKGVSRGLVLSDAGYGIDTGFRTGLTELGLRYVVGVQSSISLWPPGQEPLPPKPWSGVGRPPKLRRRDEEHKPVSALELAKSLSAQAWRAITWREGTNAPLASRFAAVRVRPAHRDDWRSEPHAEEWLLIEWPKGEKEPTKYWLSTLPKRTTRTELVAAAKGRWRIEIDQT